MVFLNLHVQNMHQEDEEILPKVSDEGQTYRGHNQTFEVDPHYLFGISRSIPPPFDPTLPLSSPKDIQGQV